MINTITYLPGHVDFQSVLQLIFLMFLIAFIVFVVAHTASFYPRFIASFAKRYKDKNALNIDNDTKFQNLNRSFPHKKEYKKNHGRSIPFFNKR